MRNQTLGLVVATLALGAGCVHQTEQPGLSGPSSLAQSISIMTNPNQLTQDGASYSIIMLRVTKEDGGPLPGASIRVDTAVNGQLVDYGTLSARTVRTGNDGTAELKYTAPPPLPRPDDSTVNSVMIVATTIVDEVMRDSHTVSTAIQLNPKGVVLPPSDVPVPNFIVPANATVGAPITFDGSASTGTVPIASYTWKFGDGSSDGNGQIVTHTYNTAGSYLVTLTVTNARGASASKSQSVTVGPAALPQPGFIFSPGLPSAGQPVQFTDTSTAVSGRTNVQWDWNFGDPTSGPANVASGRSANHTFNPTTVPQQYTVILTVTDDLGQKASATLQVAVK